MKELAEKYLKAAMQKDVQALDDLFIEKGGTVNNNNRKCLWIFRF